MTFKLRNLKYYIGTFFEIQKFVKVEEEHMEVQEETVLHRSAHENYGLQKKGNCFLHHITAPDLSGKDETVLKKNFQNMCSGYFFPERNFILRIFLFGIDFLFLFPDFYFRNTIISFPDFFFQNVLFFNSGFFCPK